MRPQPEPATQLDEINPESALTGRIFIGRKRLNRQSVYCPTHGIAECAINHLMALQGFLACKLSAHNQRLKVRVVIAAHIYPAALQSGSN